MSNTQYAFLKKSQEPGREALQASIDALGFDLTLYPDFSPLEDSGFLPCTLNGIAGVGFELNGEAAGEVVRGDNALRRIAGENDYGMSLVWGGSVEDRACAMIVSCALAKDFGAVVSYQGQAPEPLDHLLRSTRHIVDDAMKAH